MQALVVRPYQLGENSLDFPADANMSLKKSRRRKRPIRALGFPVLCLASSQLCFMDCSIFSQSPVHRTSHTSHYHALGAAASLGVVVANIHRLDSTSSVGHATALRVALHLAVVTSDLTDDVVEGLVDVDP